MIQKTCRANNHKQESKSPLPTNKSRVVAGSVIGKMAANAVAAVQDHLGSASIPGAADHDRRDSPASTSSSLTTVESSTFDSVPDAHDGTLSKVDVNGLLRYGSYDADDTGLSSVTSSGPPDGKRPFRKIESSSNSHVSFDEDERARKRLALSPSKISDTNSIPKHATMPREPLPKLENQPDASNGARHARIDKPHFKIMGPRLKKASKIERLKTDVRPRASIPTHYSWEEYGRQCVLAAQMSRLNPYALHPGEFRLLRDHITQAQVTTYLNIRNGILRLWTRNPLVSVTKEEAAGCAKDVRFFDLAYTAYQWLVRNGYINFGCVDIPYTLPSTNHKLRKDYQPKTIAVIGAGMAGLGCARQLDALFNQLYDHWSDKNELPPKIIILEARNRIGGRVYSHPLRSQVIGSLPDGLRNTAEMGAQIITGFEHGNPLNAIVRGQLGLRYHLMWDEITMHDCDGQAVNRGRDLMVNKIHSDLLERTSDFRIKPTPQETLEGLPEYVDVCQDPVEVKMKEGTSAAGNAPAIDKGRQQAVPPGFAKLQGRTQVVAGNSSTRTAAQAVKAAGWELRPGVSSRQTVSFDKVLKSAPNPALGAAMDECVRQYQDLVDLTPQDMRLLNWHYADLEYANASPVSGLSLSGHDQDSGNEFEGRHSEVVGGYIQVPRGLLHYPTKLDVRLDSVVKRVKYSPQDPDGAASIECENGHVIEADRIVLTSPLGVLKAQTIAFEPPLPDWKQGAIERMGFGLLNKVVLVFEQAFWNENLDMFGFLNEAEHKNSMEPSDYSNRRGRFYLIWNCVKNSGRPMLSALMAGKAAHEVETTNTETLLKEVMGKLSATFPDVPAPVEVIVTRWKRDPFTRGTYSFVGPDTKPGDYDAMAAPVGNLHFAGEATIGTHPATVHGAYLSGLRAASEIVDSLIGEIGIPTPLVLPKQPEASAEKESPLFNNLPATVTPSTKVTLKRAGKAPGRPKTVLPSPAPAVVNSTVPHINPYRSSNNSRSTQDEDYEACIIATILDEIGERPIKPGRPGVNPFLLFTNDYWPVCKEECTAAKRASGGNVEICASRNEIRAEVGRRWRVASEEEKRPYFEQCATAQRAANEAKQAFERDSAKWDEDASRIRLAFVQANPRPGEPSASGGSVHADTPLSSVFGRRKGAVNYTELSEEDR